MSSYTKRNDEEKNQWYNAASVGYMYYEKTYTRHRYDISLAFLLQLPFAGLGFASFIPYFSCSGKMSSNNLPPSNPIPYSIYLSQPLFLVPHDDEIF